MSSSTPHMPIDVGEIDFVIDDPGIHAKVMNWKRFEFKLYTSSSDIAYRYQWFHFVLSTHSNIEIRLFEIPDTTLWMTLYKSAGPGIMTEIGISRGGATEQFVEDLQSGDYYVKVECEPNVRHLPDGTNMGRISFRALPVFIIFEPPPERADFGEVSLGTTNSMTASFFYFNERIMDLDKTFQGGLCPTLDSRSSPGRNIVYMFHLSRRGVVSFGNNRVDTFNWPPFATRVFLDGIRDVTNGSTVIEPGNHTLVIGDHSQVVFLNDDTYCRYDGIFKLLNYV